MHAPFVQYFLIIILAIASYLVVNVIVVKINNIRRAYVGTKD